MLNKNVSLKNPPLFNPQVVEMIYQDHDRLLILELEKTLAQHKDLTEKYELAIQKITHQEVRIKAFEQQLKSLRSPDHEQLAQMQNLLSEIQQMDNMLEDRLQAQEKQIRLMRYKWMEAEKGKHKQQNMDWYLKELEMLKKDNAMLRNRMDGFLQEVLYNNAYCQKTQPVFTPKTRKRRIPVWRVIKILSARFMNLCKQYSYILYTPITIRKNRSSRPGH